MRNKIFLLLLAGTCTINLCSQDLDTLKLNSYFEVLNNANKIMGSVAVAKKNKLIYHYTIGYSDIQNQIKADASTTYGIGSISKSFTATLIMKAMEESKIKLNDKLSKFFPSIKNSEAISIEHLLRHRSGIPNFTDDPSYFDWNEKEKTKQEMLEFIAQSGSDFPPDSISQYSNSNYVLLSYILEELYHLSYAEILEAKIIEPLNLKETYFGNQTNPMQNESKSYQFMGHWDLSEKTHPSVSMGAGGIFSTPTDIVKFSYGLFSGKILSSESLKKMTIIEEGYGLGLFPVPFYDKIGYAHSGGIDGFRSFFAFFPSDSISFAFLSNGNNYTVNDISIAVLSAVYAVAYEIPKFIDYSVDPIKLQEYVGYYFSEQIPLEISLTLEDGQLFAQATGQSKFPLVAKAENIFVYEAAGLEMHFDPKEKSFILKQVGQEYTFSLKSK